VKAQNITYLDLVDPTVSTVAIDSGIFHAEILPGTSGTGNFDTFLRINGSPTAHGYNTSAKGVLDNLRGPWTHDITVGDMSVVQDLTGRYLISVGLDLNEPNAEGARYKSLDAFQVYVSPIGSQSTTNPGELGRLVYDMDALRDHSILLDVNRNSSGGSGRSDLNIYLDIRLFEGAKQSDYLYFYMKTGGVMLGEAPQYPTYSFASDGGFDELRREYSILANTSVPEPGTVMLWLLAATGFTAKRSRR
jgi:hypothetical protein